MSYFFFLAIVFTESYCMQLNRRGSHKRGVSPVNEGINACVKLVITSPVRAVKARATGNVHRMLGNHGNAKAIPVTNDGAPDSTVQCCNTIIKFAESCIAIANATACAMHVTQG